jgi:uncharacterized membrane protein YidH (DUF202 family)
MESAVSSQLVSMARRRLVSLGCCISAYYQRGGSLTKLLILAKWSIMKTYIFSSLLAFVVPVTRVFAQTVSGPIGDTLTQVLAIVQQLIPLLVAVAVLMFFWGIVKFIANMGDENARKGGKHLMVWGMIALFVMVSFWGIIGYFQESFNISGTLNTPTAPTLVPVPTVAS